MGQDAVIIFAGILLVVLIVGGVAGNLHEEGKKKEKLEDAWLWIL